MNYQAYSQVSIRVMVRSTLLMALLLSASAEARYVFSINDYLTTQCVYSDVEGAENIESMIENGMNAKCSSSTDVEGTVMVTCKKTTTTMIYSAVSEGTCNRIRSSMNDLIGR